MALGGFGGLGGLSGGVPGRRFAAGELAAGRRSGLGLGTRPPGAWDAMRRAYRYLAPYKWWVALYAVLWLISTNLDAFIPIMVRAAIDKGIVAGDAHALTWSIVAALGLYLGKAAFGFGHLFTFHFYEAIMARDLRADLFRKLQTLSYRVLDRVDTGQLIARSISDVDALQHFMGHGTNSIVTSLGSYIIVLIYAWNLSWQLTLLSMAVLPLLVLTATAYGRATRPLYSAVQQSYGRLTGVLEEFLSGVRVVKAFAREPEQRARFDESAREFLERNNRLSFVSSVYVPALVCVASLGTAVVLWVGGRMTIDGTITVGTIIAFNYYLARLVGPTRRVGFIIGTLSRAVASAQRIFEIMDTVPDVQDRPGAVPLENPRGEVVFEHVSFEYEPGRPVLQDISFVAKPGQVIGIVGETGSGKSALIGLIPRFYDVTSGRVLVDGFDVRDLTLASLRAAITIAPQDVFLFNEPLRDNIAYARPDAAMDEVERAARYAQAHRFAAALPQGYATEVGERGSRLSGGQRQRTSLARALLPEPRILILDDTTSSVDTQTERQIEAALRRVMAGKTTFIVSHRVSSVRRADEILVLEKGRIVERGTHDELVRLGGIYARMVAVQTGEQEYALRTTYYVMRTT